MDLHSLPTVNACLNTLAAILLSLGWRAIKQGKKEVHRKFMIAALITSALFLTSYLTYHILSPGVTRYPNEGFIRVVYFFILGTHTPLAIAIVPFCIAAVYFAIKKDFSRHVKITKWLMPTWLYVSVTGVVIYLMLYVF